MIGLEDKGRRVGAAYLASDKVFQAVSQDILIDEIMD